MDNNMMNQSPHIQWFPGHMAKTRRIMQENLKLVDLVVELRDARIPYSSSNPEIKKLVGDKPHIVVLAKPDLADAKTTGQWIDYFNSQSTPALAIDSRQGKGLGALEPLVRKTIAPVLEHREKRGMGGLPIRLMIVGVPNVGKSSLINRLSGGRPTRVEDRPGVTRQKQWIKVAGGLELLDMPGVLWPRFQDPLVGENLALTGAIKDDVVDLELLAMRLLFRLYEGYPDRLEERYGLAHEEGEGLDSYGLLQLVGRKRSMLIRGGEIDTLRAANVVLDDFRSGRLGVISLETPPQK